MAHTLIVGATGGIKVIAEGHEIDNITSVTLPDIEQKAEEVQGSGLLGSVAIPTPGHFSAMNTTISIRAAGKDKRYLLQANTNLEIRMAANMRATDGTMYVSGTRMYVNGTPVKVTNGSAEIGKAKEESYEYSTTRYREVVDGEETVLIDQIAGVYKVGGIDMLSGLHNALD